MIRSELSWQSKGDLLGLMRESNELFTEAAVTKDNHQHHFIPRSGANYCLPNPPGSRLHAQVSWKKKEKNYKWFWIYFNRIKDVSYNSFKGTVSSTATSSPKTSSVHLQNLSRLQTLVIQLFRRHFFNIVSSFPILRSSQGDKELSTLHRLCQHKVILTSISGFMGVALIWNELLMERLISQKLSIQKSWNSFKSPGKYISWKMVSKEDKIQRSSSCCFDKTDQKTSQMVSGSWGASPVDDLFLSHWCEFLSHGSMAVADTIVQSHYDQTNYIPNHNHNHIQ